jgi:hypothetical protein
VPLESPLGRSAAPSPEPPSKDDRWGVMVSFLKNFENEQKARTKAQNQASALRRMHALASRSPHPGSVA